MLGKELIKIIQDKNLEEFDFCIVDRNCGYIKKSAISVITWEKAKDKIKAGHYNNPDEARKKYGSSYDTKFDYETNGSKIAILTTENYQGELI